MATEAWRPPPAYHEGEEHRARAETRRLYGHELDVDLPVKWPRRSDLTTTLRDIVREWTAGEPLTTEAAAIALQTIGVPHNRYWRDRAAAARMLGFAPLTDAQREAAFLTLTGVCWDRRMPRDSGRRFERFLSRVAWTVGPVVMLFTLLGLLTAGPEMGLLVLLTTAIVLTAFLSPFVFAYSHRVERGHIQEVRGAALFALGRLRDPRGVDLLAATAHERDPRVWQAARSALIETLPSLGERNYGKVSADVTRSLCYLMNARDPELTLRIVEAMGRAGGGAAVEPVRHVLGGAWPPTVLAAAQRALPVLEARQAKEREAGRLLRAATDPNAPDTTLLRPAHGATESPPEVLLRPGEWRDEG